MKQIYYKSTGYSFTHMGRMFLRLFVGMMLVQFGIRQLMGGSPDDDIVIPLLSTGLHTWLVIIVEIICPFFIMIGLFTRLMIIPPFILMIVASHATMVHEALSHPESLLLLTVTFLFMGIFFFLFLCGAGKISVDYFYSLYLISRDNGEEEDLEVV